MSDEQGVGTLHDGEFSRQTTGATLKDLLSTTGKNGRRFVEQTSEPSNPQNGDVYLADGTSWDPDGDGLAGAELVIYYGTTWTEIVGGLS